MSRNITFELDRLRRRIDDISTDGGAGGGALSTSVTVTNWPGTQQVAGTITVANPTVSPETGLAKDATLTSRLPAALDADGGLKVHVQNPSGGGGASAPANNYSVTNSAALSAFTTIVGEKPIFTMWHPATVAATVKVHRVELFNVVSHTAGDILYQLGFISAENAAPLGTVETAQAHNRANAASGLTIRRQPTGAPTKVGAPLASLQKARVAVTGGAPDSGMVLFQSSDIVEPIVLRGGQAEGLYCYGNVTAALTGAPIVGFRVTFQEA